MEWNEGGNEEMGCGMKNGNGKMGYGIKVEIKRWNMEYRWKGKDGVRNKDGNELEWNKGGNEKTEYRIKMEMKRRNIK